MWARPNRPTANSGSTLSTTVTPCTAAIWRSPSPLIAENKTSSPTPAAAANIGSSDSAGRTPRGSLCTPLRWPHWYTRWTPSIPTPQQIPAGHRRPGAHRHTAHRGLRGTRHPAGETRPPTEPPPTEAHPHPSRPSRPYNASPAGNKKMPDPIILPVTSAVLAPSPSFRIPQITKDSFDYRRTCTEPQNCLGPLHWYELGQSVSGLSPTSVSRTSQL